MLTDCIVTGPMLTPGFTAEALPALLTRHALWPEASAWPPFRQGIDTLAASGGPIRVLRHIAETLAPALGFSTLHPAGLVTTREGPEDGGYLPRKTGPRASGDSDPRASGNSGSRASGDSDPRASGNSDPRASGDSDPRASGTTGPRIWVTGTATPLDTIANRRASLPRIAARVLRAQGEIAGLITNGLELRLLLCDPAGGDSQITARLSAWQTSAEPPAAFRVIMALASARGLAALPLICDAARLHQASVTKTLRGQARAAIEGFLQAVLDQPGTAAADPALLWRQALTIVYRLLFILKLESAAEPGRGFSFATSALWRHAFSPNQALGPLVRRHFDHGHDTGRMLEDGLRVLFRVCHEGLSHAALSIAPLGRGLFDPAATAALDALPWGEPAVAILLDRLLWTQPKAHARERVHYGALDVEELGHIYEALLELEPAIAIVPMIRTKRGRLEAVIPAPKNAPEPAALIPPGRFFTRTGLGRRAGGSYYTPNGFVAHLVHETLTPLIAGPIVSADPAAILRLKIIDPAMGSGHFLVAACRFLADALYEACRRCDALDTPEAHARIDALPDPDRRLAAYLPSRAAGPSDFGPSDIGPSRAWALAICRRMVTVHCLYGIDRDPLAVELAKVALWLESFAEGLPLTFLDHRLITGDSLSGPFIADLAFLPVGGAPLDPLLARGVADRLHQRAAAAITEVAHLNASIGGSIADVLSKQAALDRLNTTLAPLRGLARAWSGAVRTRARHANDAFLDLARTVAATGELPADLHAHQTELLTHGATAIPLDLTFPEIFLAPERKSPGFDVVLGNPPWDVIHYQTKEFLAAYDPAVMDAPTKRERESLERTLLADPEIAAAFTAYKNEFVERKRLTDRLFPAIGAQGSIDLFQVFMERMLDCVAGQGALGVVVPSSFHANEGTAHLRRRVLEETKLESCYTFENRRKWFDVHGRLKFSLLVTRRAGPTTSFRCGFYLDSLAQLNDPERIMTYDRDFLTATSGASNTFLELSGAADHRIAQHLFIGHDPMGPWLHQQNIVFGREAHMTDDSHRFSPASDVTPETGLILHEGKTFHQFTDRWHASPRYAIRFDAMTGKPAWRRAAGHARLAFREIARANDERTMIAAFIPPGHVFGHKGTCEKTPWARTEAAALTLCAVFNSFTFDWCVRRKIAASLSLFMLHACPAPRLTKSAAKFLADGTKVLSGSARTRQEALPPGPPPRAAALGTIPLGLFGGGPSRTLRRRGRPSPEQAQKDGGPGTLSLAEVEEAAPPHWAWGSAPTQLRAEMDAVIAHAYALTREDYAHILSGFSHKSHPTLPMLCLAAYDRIASPIASPTLIPSTPADRIPPA